MRPKDTPCMVSPTSVGYSENPWCELFNLICHVGPFDYPNSPLWDVRNLTARYDNFEFLWKIRKYSDSGWLVLAPLGKLRKESDELKASTDVYSLLVVRTNWQRKTRSLKIQFSSSRYREEIEVSLWSSKEISLLITRLRLQNPNRVPHNSTSWTVAPDMVSLCELMNASPGTGHAATDWRMPCPPCLSIGIIRNN